MRAAGALAAALTMAARPAPIDPAEQFARQELGIGDFRRADADLNGDGRAEALFYVTDPGRCGSGGCSLVILSPQDEGYRIVLRSTVTRLPIALLPTSAHGWRDLAVTVAGGGIRPPRTVRLRFGGSRYPANPTVAPAAALDGPPGEVLIAPEPRRLRIGRGLHLTGTFGL